MVDMHCEVLQQCLELDEMRLCKIKHSDLNVFGGRNVSQSEYAVFLEDLDVDFYKDVNDNAKVISAGDVNLPHLNWNLSQYSLMVRKCSRPPLTIVLPKLLKISPE